VALPRALCRKARTRQLQQAALARFASSMLAGDGRYRRSRDILAGVRRALRSHAGFEIQTTDLRIAASAHALARFELSLHPGPAGHRKDVDRASPHHGAHAQGRRVGVAATSHKAIHNLLDEVVRRQRRKASRFAAVKKARRTSPRRISTATASTTRSDRRIADAGSDILLFAGTRWLFAHEALDGKVDYARHRRGRAVSLADALAMGTSARNIVLLGDPLQLAQVSQGRTPRARAARCSSTCSATT
jgi:uncharacterized protein